MYNDNIMFYNIISKIPKIVEATKKKKMLYILIIGTLIYIIIHAFLFSKQSESIGVITKYRNYVYLVMLLDFGIMYMTLKEDTPKENKPEPKKVEVSEKEESEEETESSESSEEDIKEPVKKKDKEEKEEDEADTLSTIEVYNKEES